MNLLAERYWAIEETAGRELMAQVRQQPLLDRIAIDGRWPSPATSADPKSLRIKFEDDDEPLFQRVNDVAVIKISGPITKNVSLWSMIFGGSSSVRLRQAVNEAAADPKTRTIMLRIDSPGGSVAGTADLADAVFNARKTKRVVAHIEDLGASAAYWIASQADQVLANRTALVGSIGTYMVIVDWSEAAKQDGAKVHVVRAGKFKGAGAAGTEITDEQLAMFQEEIDALNEHFLEGVARGRRMDLARVRQIADGRVHVGAAAQQIGLIDGIASADEVIAQLSTPTDRLRLNA